MALIASDPEGDLFFSERQRPKYDIVSSKRSGAKITV